MPSENIVTRVFGANSFAIGEVVHVTSDRAVARAQANVPGLTGAIGLSLGWTTVFAGVQRVLLEVGLVPVAGQVLYVSAQLGRATNVAPAVPRGFATILDASMYSPTNPFVVCVMSDAPGGAGTDCCPSRIDHLANDQVTGPAADDVTDYTYILDGGAATINLPASNAANKGRRITVNVIATGGTATVRAALGDTVEDLTGLAVPVVAVAPGGAGVGLVLAAVTWQADGAGAWVLFSNYVYSAPV